MVYLVVVYDVEATRTRHFRNFLRQHLHHVQNSVFEGEVTEGDAETIETRLESMLEEAESAIVYRLPAEKFVDRSAFGEDPAEDARFL